MSLRSYILVSFLFLTVLSNAMEKEKDALFADRLALVGKNARYRHTLIATVIRRHFSTTIDEKYYSIKYPEDKDHPFMNPLYRNNFVAMPSSKSNSWAFLYIDKGITGIHDPSDNVLKEFTNVLHYQGDHQKYNEDLCYYYHTFNEGETLIQTSRNALKNKKRKSIFVDIAEFDLRTFTPIVSYMYSEDGQNQLINKVQYLLDKKIPKSDILAIIQDMITQKELELSEKATNKQSAKKQKTS